MSEGFSLKSIFGVKIHQLKQSWTVLAELTVGAGVLSRHRLGPPCSSQEEGTRPGYPVRVQSGAFPLWSMLPGHGLFLLCQGSGPVKDYIRVKSCLSKGNVPNAAGCLPHICDTDLDCECECEACPPWSIGVPSFVRTLKTSSLAHHLHGTEGGDC